jgi:glycosyltransferase involved in cell wall biosynthesis
MTDRISLSVVVPVFQEEENVATLVQAVKTALREVDCWELLLVDDGSRDATPEIAERLAAADPRVRLVQLARNYGQTPAMQAGFDHSRGAAIVTMDGDLQNDPQDIPRLLAKLNEGYDLVAGYRERRRDRWLTRKVPSWIANRIIEWMTGVPIRDNGCSLKAYRRDLLTRLHLYSDMHRFIPAVAATAGARIAQIPVRHHRRLRGKSKYGLSRVAKVLADLLTIKMIRSFRERPLALFGAAALAACVLGIAFIAAGLTAFLSFQTVKANAIVFPGAALLWFGLACYLLMLGLIGEVALKVNRATDVEKLPVVREETS